MIHFFVCDSRYTRRCNQTFPSFPCLCVVRIIEAARWRSTNSWINTSLAQRCLACTPRVSFKSRCGVGVTLART